MTSNQQPTKTSILDKGFELLKLHLMGDGNLGYSGILVAAGLAIYGPDQSNFFYVLQIIGKLIGLVIPNAPDSPLYVRILGIGFLVFGLLVGVFHFIGPKIKPLKQLIKMASYQPISSKQIVSEIRKKADCWLVPLSIDLTEENHRGSDGQKRSVFKILKKIKKLNQNRELYFCGICHIPYVMLAGFYLRNFKLHFLEIDHHSKQPKLLQDQPADTTLQLNVAQDIKSFTENIGLLISVSYLIKNDSVESIVGTNSEILHLSTPTQGLSILNSEADIERFAKIIRSQLDRFVGNSVVKTIHLFYSGPTSLAFRIGQLLSQNTDPKVISYNWESGMGYRWGVSLNKGEPHV